MCLWLQMDSLDLWNGKNFRGKVGNDDKFSCSLLVRSHIGAVPCGDD